MSHTIYSLDVWVDISSLKMHRYIQLQSLLSFESNLVMIATSSVISQKLDGSSLSRLKHSLWHTDCPFTFFLSVNLVAGLQFFNSSQLSVYTLYHHLSSFTLYHARWKKKKKSGDLILGIKNIEHSPVYKMTETEEYTAKAI